MIYKVKRDLTGKYTVIGISHMLGPANTRIMNTSPTYGKEWWLVHLETHKNGRALAIETVKKFVFNESSMPHNELEKIIQF